VHAGNIVDTLFDLQALFTPGIRRQVLRF